MQIGTNDKLFLTLYNPGGKYLFSFTYLRDVLHKIYTGLLRPTTYANTCQVSTYVSKQHALKAISFQILKNTSKLKFPLNNSPVILRLHHYGVMAKFVRHVINICVDQKMFRRSK